MVHPSTLTESEAALDYLARYVVGSAISDARIVSDEYGQVTIRIKDYRQGAARDTISIIDSKPPIEEHWRSQCHTR